LERFEPELRPPLRWGEGPRVELRDRVRDSPERARFLLTVRAAISFARPADAPRFRALRLIFVYCLARLVPFLTPRGGISYLLRLLSDHAVPDAREAKRARLRAWARAPGRVCAREATGN